MDESKAKIALTIGDPCGVGPEITASLMENGTIDMADTFVIGMVESVIEYLPETARKRIPVIASEDARSWNGPFPVLVDAGVRMDIVKGVVTKEGGLVSAKGVEIAVALVKEGIAEGIVTGPISKEALSLAGYPFRGHTNMLSRLFEEPDCQMLMVAGGLKILILTRDMALREVPAKVTRGKIVSGISKAVEGLKLWWGIEEPRVAVSALNPHAGDGGVLGKEEIDEIIPAVKELASSGFSIDGPFPADTLFFEWERKGYDLFVAMYHDQGMIPFKMIGFLGGVNVTVGLPVIRTSVSHGTAYDIAGKGKAKTESLENAFELAVRCALTKRGVKESRR